MKTYLLRRVLMTVVLLYVVATMLFLFIHLIPGDPAEIILGSSEHHQPTREQIETIRIRLGLDRPLHEQYVSYFSNLLRGDMGVSFLTGRQVSVDLRLRFGRTMQLVLPAIVISSVLGIVLGIMAAQSRGTWLDAALSGVSVLGHCVPVFVVGPVIVLVISIRLGWLPSSGYIEFGTEGFRSLRYMILPVITLATGRIATTMRMTRMAMVEQLVMDYVRTARAKGLSERLVVYRHALKNALLPVVTVIGLQLGVTFTGGLIVESVFNWPGLSSMLIRALTNRDYPTIQGTVLLSSTIFVLINLLTDLAYAYLDPRLHYQ